MVGRFRSKIVDGKKLCSHCKQWIVVDDFSPAKNTSTKLDSQCRTCRNKTHAASRGRSLKLSLQTLAYANKLGLVRRKSRRSMIADSCICTQFLMDLWRKQDGKCALTGIPMTHIAGHGRVTTNVSIDRIDSTWGYTPDNVRLVCYAVNQMKHAMSDEELLVWCNRVIHFNNTNNNVNKE